MNELIIHIGWPQAIGIIGTIITITWIYSRKIGVIETNIEWLKDMVREMRNNLEKLSLHSDLG